MILERLDLDLLRLPLRKPYHLAFGDVVAFDTVVVELRGDDECVGIGEATLLAAYGGETLEDAWDFCLARCAELAGMTIESGKAHLARWLHDFPFCVSAFNAAMEMLEGNALLSPREEIRVPILGAVSAEGHAEIRDEVGRLLEQGYGTLKVKVGFDLQADLARVRMIQDAVAGRALLRLDGNQGYGVDEACRFAAQIDPRGIELLEQPCAADDWEAAAAVSRVARVPMMLDESIFGIEDIERAADLGIASFIKLKLLKMGGLERLADALERIRSLGMEPVLGNGVAAEVACWMEACVAVSTIRNAGEFNGFLRPVSGILTEPLRLEAGDVVIAPGFVAELDRDAMAAHAVTSHRSRSSSAKVAVSTPIRSEQ